MCTVGLQHRSILLVRVTNEYRSRVLGTLQSVNASSPEPTASRLRIDSPLSSSLWAL